MTSALPVDSLDGVHRGRHAKERGLEVRIPMHSSYPRIEDASKTVDFKGLVVSKSTKATQNHFRYILRHPNCSPFPHTPLGTNKYSNLTPGQPTQMYPDTPCMPIHILFIYIGVVSGFNV